MGTTDGWPFVAMTIINTICVFVTRSSLFNPRANLRAQRGADNAGGQYWELSQLTDPSATQMWRDLYKGITASTAQRSDPARVRMLNLV